MASLAVPTYQTLQPYSGRFAWHMYSRLRPDPHGEVELADGTRRSIAMRSHVHMWAYDFNFTAQFARAACAHTPGAVRVQLWYVPAVRPPQAFACRP